MASSIWSLVAPGRRDPSLSVYSTVETGQALSMRDLLWRLPQSSSPLAHTLSIDLARLLIPSIF